MAMELITAAPSQPVKGRYLQRGATFHKGGGGPLVMRTTCAHRQLASSLALLSSLTGCSSTSTTKEFGGTMHETGKIATCHRSRWWCRHGRVNRSKRRGPWQGGQLSRAGLTLLFCDRMATRRISRPNYEVKVSSL